MPLKDGGWLEEHSFTQITCGKIRLVAFSYLYLIPFFTKNKIALDICVCVQRRRLILKTLKVFLSLKHNI